MFRVQDAHEFLNTVLQQLSSISRELKSVADEKKLTYTCPVEAHIRFQMLNTRHCKRYENTRKTPLTLADVVLRVHIIWLFGSSPDFIVVVINLK